MSPSTQKITRVAVLFGGVSSEREVSLKSGTQICGALKPSAYEVLPIEIISTGEWMLHGNTIEPKDIKALCDVVFIALHGPFGEDGKVQGLLESFKIPYTGSGVLASALCMNKVMAKRVAATAGIKTPKGIVVQRGMEGAYLAERVAQEVGFPCFVKPNASGSSIGATRVDEKGVLAHALEKALHEDVTVLVEQYVRGRELTCGVLGNASCGGVLEVLPPVEIIPDNTFFDYQAKYLSQGTNEICPAKLTLQETGLLQALARQAHEMFGCDGLSRTDVLLQDGEFYFLETNTVPGMTAQSLCPKEACAMGHTFEWLVERIIGLAKEKAANLDPRLVER